MPHKTAIVDVMNACYGALNVAGMTALAPVYNHVPQGTSVPYVVLGSPTEARFDAMQSPGKELTIQVHVVSGYRGDAQAATILSKAIELLHYARPTVSGHTLIAIQYESGDSYTELVEGQEYRHLIGTFRVRVEQST